MARKGKLSRILVPAALLLLLVGLLLARVFRPAGPAERPEARISAFDAEGYIGRVAEVCGVVASADYLPQVRGAPTFLNLGRAHPDQPFTAVIFGEHRRNWPAPPEQYYLHREICVTGRIREHRGRPQIVVREPGQIQSH